MDRIDFLLYGYNNFVSSKNKGKICILCTVTENNLNILPRYFCSNFVTMWLAGPSRRSFYDMTRDVFQVHRSPKLTRLYAFDLFVLIYCVRPVIGAINVYKGGNYIFHCLHR